MALQALGGAFLGAGAQGLTGPVGLLAAYQANATMPIVIPDLSDLITLYVGGWIDRTRFRDHAKEHGVDLPNINADVFTYAGWDGEKAIIRDQWISRIRTPWEGVVASKVYMPSITESLYLCNRGLISESLARNIINVQCDGFSPIGEAWFQSRYEIPGPSDLVRFALRDVWDQETVQTFGYHKEFPLEIIPWMEKQGYGQSMGIRIPNEGTDNRGAARTGNATWSDAFWWSHWQLPSPTQGYDMLHKLYPMSPRGASPLQENYPSFTSAQLSMLLKANDYPDFWRQRLEAISYLTLHLSDVQRLLNWNMITENRAYHYNRAHGFNHEDAENMLKIQKKNKDLFLGLDLAKEGLAAICKAHKNGALPEANAKEQIKALGYTDADARKFIAKCQLDLVGDMIEEQLKHWKHGVLNGILSRAQAREIMLRDGMDEFIADTHLARWEFVRNNRFKQISAQKAIKYFINNVLTEQDLQARLFNLNYTPRDVSAMIIDARRTKLNRLAMQLQKEVLRLQREAKAAQLKALREQKEKLKLIKEDRRKAAQILAKRQRAFIKVSTDANLVAWYKAGLIKLWEVYYRLYYKDYSVVDANRWVKTKLGIDEGDNTDVASKKAETAYRDEGNPPIDAGSNRKAKDMPEGDLYRNIKG